MTSKTTNTDWKQRLHDALHASPSTEADLALSALAYEVAGTRDPEVVDLLMQTFGKGLDSSLLQSYINALGSVPFEVYCGAYSRNVSTLLKAAPRWAVSLLNYPGSEISEAQCEQLVAAILSGSGSLESLDQLDSLILEFGLSSEHPWSAVLRRPRSLIAR